MAPDEPTRVLIVDDDEAIREVLRVVLEDEGYQVIEAPDGLVALEMLRAMPVPMVVLTNHNMPRLDGPGLVNFVVEDPALAQRNAFIYMTAGNRVIHPAFARQLETLEVPVIRKPFELDALLAAVDHAARDIRAGNADTVPEAKREEDPATPS